MALLSGLNRTLPPRRLADREQVVDVLRLPAHQRHQGTPSPWPWKPRVTVTREPWLRLARAETTDVPQAASLADHGGGQGAWTCCAHGTRFPWRRQPLLTA